MSRIKLILIFFFALSLANSEISENRPHIVLIVADDLGWNDVSFHGANQIPTPNIDALAYNGVILNRFYTLPTCTPSRTALLTGQYPIKLGLQGLPITAGENRFLPPNVPVLPEKLKELGYTTKLVGKWHLGATFKNVTPTNRGFDYHYGYWNGYIGYFNHEASNTEGMHGLDMHENFETQWNLKNKYATDVFTRKAQDIILQHNESVPLFLMLSQLAPHAGTDNIELEVPDVQENDERFGYIQDERRRLYAGMVHELDKSVGNVVETLSKKKILNNTLIIFFSDNGAKTVGFTQNRGSNWPLRGMKTTVLEGGIRNVAIMYSSQLQTKGFINDGLFHISDMMPTLYAAAGGNVSQLKDIDGVNQWPALLKTSKSDRTKLLVNIDEVRNSSALIGENGRYKLINGSTISDLADDDYFGDDGRGTHDPPYNITAVLQSATNVAIGNRLTEAKILELRQNSDLGNCRRLDEHNFTCSRDNLCLFDLVDDPCETTNLVAQLPEIVAELSRELLEYWSILQLQKPTFVDPKANPIYYNNSWYTWLDS